MTVSMTLTLLSCARQSTPTPQPTYTPVPLDRVWQDAAYGAVADNVASVVEGVVIEKEGDRTIGRYGYSDWSVEVMRYLVDPLPFERITVCIAEWETGPEGERLRARVAYYHLSPGEHVILFLGKQSSLKEDEFVLPGAPHFEWRKVTIEEGKVQFWGALGARHSGEPVEEFIARLQQYAREAGRTIPPPPPTLRPGVIQGSGPVARPEDYLYDADTVVIGRVTEGLPEQQTVLRDLAFLRFDSTKASYFTGTGWWRWRAT